MRHHKPYIAVVVAGLMTLAIVFLLAAQNFHSSTATALDPALQEADPVAVVKSILVNGAEQVQAAESDMRVTRVTSEVQAGQTGMLLVPGDEIGTGPSAKVTLLFLDAAPEKDNEVLIDSNARMRVGSIFNLLGRVLVRSKGKFTAATDRVKIDEEGTEYELVVQPDGTNRIRVLDGALRVQKGSFFPSTTRDDSRQIDEPLVGDGEVSFVRSSFSEQTRTARQAVTGTARPGKMEFVAIRGQTTSFERDFTFTNRCNLKHQYEIRSNITWFRVMGANIFELDGRESNSISFAMRADATRVPIGVYEGEIRARCLDCAEEEGCDVGGLNLDISVSVIPARGGPVDRPDPPATPTLRASPSPQLSPQVTPVVTRPVSQSSTLAQELQQVILGPDGTLKTDRASEAEIEETINWSNDVIVAAQPTYSSESIIPHLQSWQERAQQFRVARRSAILNNDADSYEALGRIYVDWGNGAKAVDELRKSINASQTPERMTSLAEAYRLTGDLRSAQSLLVRTLRQYPDHASALNALGNVYFDRARVAQDKEDFGSARADLQTARQHYERAKINSAAFIVSESNIAETELTLGDIAREQGRLDEAMNQYKQAEQTFSRVEQTSRSYVFATKGLGDVYRGMSGIARIQQNSDFANAIFTRSQEKYRQVVQSNRDVSEAYIGLGKLYEDHGYKDRAIAAYGQAIRVRPEVSQGYYHYAIVIAEKNPGLAANYAKAYLKLERGVFKQGKKAANATKVADQRWAPPPTPSPTNTSTVTPPPPSPPPPSPSATVKVPGVNGNKPDEALRKLKERGLEGQLANEPDCKANGKVVATNPKKDTKVSQGTVVTVYISSLAENAVPVPQVTNQSLGDAQLELQRLGLAVNARRREETNAVPENTVLRQDPKAHTRLNPGCTVDLTVAIPVRLIPVPRYIGLSREEAFRQLPRIISFGGLIRGSVTEVDSRMPPGTVVGQNPRPGEMVEPGKPVDLYISRSRPSEDDVGPSEPTNDVPVPPLFGQTVDQARNTLAQYNLKLGRVGEKIAQGNQRLGIVVGQDPPRGGRARRGDAVNITITVAPPIYLRQRIRTAPIYRPTPTPTPRDPGEE